MKKNVLFFMSVIAALAFVSCNKEIEPGIDSGEMELVTFTSYSEEPEEDGGSQENNGIRPDTKVSLNTGNKFIWEKGDEIAVFVKKNADTTADGPYKFTAQKGGRTSDFKGYLPVAEEGVAYTYYALYPYDKDAEFLINSNGKESISSQIATEQTIVAGSIPRETPFTATTDATSKSFKFKANVNFVKFTLVVGDKNVKTVTLKDKNGAGITGNYNMVVGAGASDPKNNVDYAKLNMEGGFTDGVYYFAIRPGQLKGGLTISFEDGEGNVIASRLSDKPSAQSSVNTVLNLNTLDLTEMSALE